MILYFAGRDFVVTGLASTANDSRFIVSSDSKNESIKNNVSVFDAEIRFSKEDELEAEQMIAPGNYILRYDNKKLERSNGSVVSAYNSLNITDCFTIIETEFDTFENKITIYAEDLGLDLLNDLAYPYTPDRMMTSAEYVSKIVEKTGFEMSSDSDILPETKLIVWDDTSTITERLNSVMAAFEHELYFSFDVKGLSIVRKNVIIKKKRGIDSHEVLSIGKNLNNITIKKTVENLATALIATGAENVGLSGYEYDDGDFYVSEGILYSRTALSNWYRYKHESGHIFRTFSCDAKTQVDLKDEAIKQLTKIREPEVTYEADVAYLPETLRIGDKVYVVDDSGELYISGRILELKTSVTGNSKQATIGDYLVESSGISSIVLNLASQFKEFAANRTLYTWLVFADDEYGTGVSLEQGEKEYIGLLNNMTKELTDVGQITDSIMRKITWQKITIQEPAVINLLSASGILFKNTPISTTVTAMIIAGETVIQDLEHLWTYYADVNMKLAWFYKKKSDQDYIRATSGISDDTFTYTYNDAEADNVSIRCSLIREVD